MPHKPKQLGSFPLVLRDYKVPNPIRGELLMDYNNNEMYFVKKSTGNVTSVARDIYDKIMASKIQNNKIHTFDYDKVTPHPDKNDIVPPVRDRQYNGIYFLIIGRRDYGSDTKNPLTVPTWAVRSGKLFLGKASGYNPDLQE